MTVMSLQGSISFGARWKKPPIKRELLGGSSQDLYVVNNYGTEVIPLPNGRTSWLIQGFFSFPHLEDHPS